MQKFIIDIDDSNLFNLKFKIKYNDKIQYFSSINEIMEYIKYINCKEIINTVWDKKVHCFTIPIFLNYMDYNNYKFHIMLNMNIKKFLALYINKLNECEHYRCERFSILKISKTDFYNIFKPNNILNNVLNYRQIIDSLYDNKEILDLSTLVYNTDHIKSLPIKIYYSINNNSSVLFDVKNSYPCSHCDKLFSSELKHITCFKNL